MSPNTLLAIITLLISAGLFLIIAGGTLTLADVIAQRAEREKKLGPRHFRHAGALLAVVGGMSIIVGLIAARPPGGPNASDAAAVMTPVGPQEILFEDDFSINSGWYEGRVNQFQALSVDEIRDGKYIMGLHANLPAINRRSNFAGLSDFRLLVEATLTSTSARPGEALAVLTFRDDGENEHYTALFANDGSAALFLRQGDLVEQLAASNPQEAVNLQQGVTNLLEIAADGPELRLYANGVQVAAVRDSRLSGPGGIGLGTGLTRGGQTLVIEYDNLVIAALP